MKKTIILTLAAGLLASTSAYSQGTIAFANSSTTLITNSLTGAAVVNSPAGAFRVALYWLPDSPTAPTTTEFATPGTNTIVGSPVAGRFSGGNYTALGIPAGGNVWVQLKAWETLFGATYEAAVNAPKQTVGGTERGALAGTSNIFKVDTGDPTTVPPGTPGSLTTATGMKGFILVPVPEPSVIALGALGIGALLLLRRRK